MAVDTYQILSASVFVETARQLSVQKAVASEAHEALAYEALA